MEPAALAIYGGIKAGAAGLKYLSNRYSLKNKPKRPKFGSSIYANYLQRVGKEGVISPEERNIIQGDVSRSTAQSAVNTRARYMGRAISRGREGSVSTNRGLNEVDLNRNRIMGDTARRIALANARSKGTAQERYAQLMYGDQQAGYQDQMNWWDASRLNRNQLIGGLGDAAGGYLSGMANNQSLPPGYDKIVADYQTHQDPAKLMYQLMQNGMSQDQALAIMAQLAG
ncbi:MAG: hypothetical protein H8E14_15210 [Candidatus Marinimicrobia bacterium]|nr:hypothetical protein [Candidatus Neomarinimicrobiota bacterium]